MKDAKSELVPFPQALSLIAAESSSCVVPSQAAEKAAEEAELQRMKDQARFQRELNQQKELEAQLRASAERSVVTPVGVSDEVLTQEVEKLRKQNTKQLQRIEK